MEPIQSVVRSLEVLHQLNLHNGATVYDMCRYIRLPRGTIYRMLETLCDAGYARRDPQTSGYWIEESCQGLAAGFQDQSWVFDVGPSVIEELRPQIPCCLALTTPDGIDMLVRASTKRRNPGASEKTIAGDREPMANNVDGHVYLAFASPERRRTLLSQIARQYELESKGGKDAKRNELRFNTIELPTTAAAKEFDKIRQRGFTMQIKGNATGATAVPVIRNGVAVGAVKMWYWLSVIKEPHLSKRYIPLLLDAAQKLASYSAQPLRDRNHSDVSA